jgi:hypothetical protein
VIPKEMMYFMERSPERLDAFQEEKGGLLER